MLKVPSWMFEGLWLHLWPHLTYAINYFFHNRGFHHIKASPNKPMDWFLHKRAPHIVTWTPGPRWRVPGGGARVPGPTNGSQVPDPTFQVCHSKETLRSETLLKRDSDTKRTPPVAASDYVNVGKPLQLNTLHCKPSLFLIFIYIFLSLKCNMNGLCHKCFAMKSCFITILSQSRGY